MAKKKLGIAIVGVGGAVGTTVAAGIELLRQGSIGEEGLPLAGIAAGGASPMVGYEDIVIAGWDLFAADLAEAAEGHDVLSHKQFLAVEEHLRGISPWPAIGNREFLVNIDGGNLIGSATLPGQIDQIRRDLRAFRSVCDDCVVMNLASTEKIVDEKSDLFSSLDKFNTALRENAGEIPPAMLYAYAAISEGIPYGNFTPSVSADAPALIEYSETAGVPIAGKDGKTGQTFIKTVLAPAFRARALKVEGWYSTNILGNRDGLALSNEESLRSKIKTKQSVLRNILGYEVEDHIVDIRYYRPRGDDKEAWDNIDIKGFLGLPMQIKVNFLCKDSVLAAPLAIEIARCLDLARRRGDTGIQEHLSVFFKMPMCKEIEPVQAFHRQQDALLEWLSEG